MPKLLAPVWKNVGHESTRGIFRDVFLNHDNELSRPEDFINHSLYFEAKTFLHGLLVVEDKLSMAHGLAHNWQVLAGLRALLGFSEGSANPAGMKATAEWFPAKERGLAGGVYNIGASVGSMIAPPLVVWAILSYNWRAAFLLTGGLGLVWVVLWLWLYESPEKHSARRSWPRVVA